MPVLVGFVKSWPSNWVQTQEKGGHRENWVNLPVGLNEKDWLCFFGGIGVFVRSATVPIVPCLDSTFKIGVYRLSEPSNNEVIANSWKRD